MLFQDRCKMLDYVLCLEKVVIKGIHINIDCSWSSREKTRPLPEKQIKNTNYIKCSMTKLVTQINSNLINHSEFHKKGNIVQMLSHKNC